MSSERCILCIQFNIFYLSFVIIIIIILYRMLHDVLTCSAGACNLFCCKVLSELHFCISRCQFSSYHFFLQGLSTNPTHEVVGYYITDKQSENNYRNCGGQLSLPDVTTYTHSIYFSFSFIFFQADPTTTQHQQISSRTEI